jgi:hypothetical protein
MAYTAIFSMAALEKDFGKWLLSRLWPTRFPDFKSGNYYLWETLKTELTYTITIFTRTERQYSNRNCQEIFLAGTRPVQTLEVNTSQLCIAIS